MIQDQLYTALLGDADVVRLVDDRIFPVRLPRNVELPAIVYQIPSVDPISSLSGDSGIDNARVILTCWASEYEDAHALASSARKALIESGMRIITSGQNDIEDQETRSFAVILNLNIWSTSNVGVPPGPLENNNEIRVYEGWIQWRENADAAWVNLIAVADLNGDQGETGVTGATGPAGADGSDGREVEIQSAGGYIQWRYVGEASWTNLVALATLKGDQGDQGLKGDTGNTGPQGVQGATGPQGIQGVKGDTGDQGPQGIQGATGPQGLKGDQGDQGIQGIQGEEGPQGPQGIQGIQGIQGVKGDKGDKGDPGDPAPSDHGLLTGLGDDDHSQYHNDSRGDARYLKLDQTTSQTLANVAAVTAVDTDYVLITDTSDSNKLKKALKTDFAGSGGLANVVEDTTPQLGGDLDGQSTYDLTNIVDAEFEGDVSVGDVLTLKSNDTFKYYLVNRPASDISVWYKIGATTGQMDGNPSDNTWQTTGGTTYAGTSAIPSLLADDGTRTAVTVGSNYTGFLVKFVLPAINQAKYTALRPEVQGFSSVNGIGMRSQIWNFNTSAWVVLATGTSFADDDDLSATITSNIADYIGASNEVYVLARNPNVGSGSALFRVDMMRLGYKAETDIDDNTWKSDFTILGDLAVGKSFRPADVVPDLASTYSLGSSDYYWSNAYVDSVSAKKIAIAGGTVTSSVLDILNTTRTNAGNIVDLGLTSSGYSTKGINLALQDFGAPTSDITSYGLYSLTYYGSPDDGGYSPTHIAVYGQANSSIFMSGAPGGTASEVLVGIGGMFEVCGEIFDEFESETYVGDITRISLFAKEPTESYGDAYVSGTVKNLAFFSEGDMLVATGKKIFLEGGWSSPVLTIGDTYVVYNSGSAQIEFYINGTLAGHINLATGFVND